MHHIYGCLALLEWVNKGLKNAMDKVNMSVTNFENRLITVVLRYI